LHQCGEAGVGSQGIKQWFCFQQYHPRYPMIQKIKIKLVELGKIQGFISTVSADNL